MKRYIKSRSQLPAGWTKKSNSELDSLGYTMDPEYIQEDKDVCKSYGCIFQGYAINEDGEIALICKDDAGNTNLYESVNGKLYLIED